MLIVEPLFVHVKLVIKFSGLGLLGVCNH